MNFVDVNVLVYAFRADAADHEAYRDLLAELGNGTQRLGLADPVLSGFLRIVTNRRIFNEPTPPREAWRQVTDLLAAPAALRCTPGPGHWEAFETLAASIEAKGGDIADAYLAAFAVERGATWLSADRGFARFPGLRWSHPLDA